MERTMDTGGESREASIGKGPKEISRATIIAIIAAIFFVIAGSILIVYFYQNSTGGENSNVSTGNAQVAP